MMARFDDQFNKAEDGMSKLQNDIHHTQNQLDGIEK